jgi:hypothetical protein
MNAYTILAGKPEGKRPLGRPSCECEDNFKMDLEGCKDVDWIHLARDGIQWQAVVNTVMNLWVP